jgi:hypothetical protein
MSDLFASVFRFLVAVVSELAMGVAALVTLCLLVNCAALLGGFCMLVVSTIVSPIVELFRCDDTEEGKQ